MGKPLLRDLHLYSNLERDFLPARKPSACFYSLTNHNDPHHSRYLTFVKPKMVRVVGFEPTVASPPD
jgi:hypothetical protein